MWNSALTVPSRGVRLAARARASRTGTPAASALAQRRRAGRSSPRSRPRRARPTPTPAGRGSAGSPGSASVASSRSRSTALQSSVARAPCASAKYLAHAGVASRRAAEELIVAGRVTVGGEVVRDPARDVDGASGVDGRRQAGRAAPSRAAVYALHKPRGRRLDREATRTGRPTVVELVPGEPAAVPGRAPGRRHHRPDPAHQRRRARQPADAPALRGPEDLPRAGRAARRCAARALRALRDGRRARGRRDRAGARRAGCAPDELELTIHEGRKRQVRRMCDAVGHPVVELERIAFGPLRLGDARAGRHRRLPGRARAPRASRRAAPARRCHECRAACDCSRCAAPPPSSANERRRHPRRDRAS